MNNPKVVLTEVLCNMKALEYIKSIVSKEQLSKISEVSLAFIAEHNGREPSVRLAPISEYPQLISSMPGIVTGYLLTLGYPPKHLTKELDFPHKELLLKTDAFNDVTDICLVDLMELH